MSRFAVTAGVALLGLLTAATGIWATLAVLYSGPQNDLVRNSAAAVAALVSLVALIAVGFRRWRWRALGTYLVLFVALVVWWRGIEPSNERDWQTDVAVLPRATIEGDVVTLHNIRNFDYRSETDYTPAYYDKRFELSKLEGVDLVAVYWMGPAIAHTFISFAFAGGEHLAISIETRKEKGEGYSTIKGFFRQYELHYVVADERDVIRLRTNYRHDPPEDVYVYRLQGSIESGRRILRRLHEADQRPQRQAGVLQHPDHQLHDQYLDALPGQRGAPAFQLEDPGQRLCAGVPVRSRPARHQRALHRAQAARPRQRPRAGGRQGGGFFPAHPGWQIERARSVHATGRP